MLKETIRDHRDGNIGELRPLRQRHFLPDPVHLQLVLVEPYLVIAIRVLAYQQPRSRRQKGRRIGVHFATRPGLAWTLRQRPDVCLLIRHQKRGQATRLTSERATRTHPTLSANSIAKSHHNY